MHAEGKQRTLEAVFAEELECTSRLLASLNAERAALTKRDMAALPRIIETKLLNTQRLENLEKERERLLAEHGFDNDSAGLRQCFEHLPEGPRLRQQWQQILASTEACRTSNLTNGGILEAGRHHVEQALAVLRGQSGTPALYDPKGEATANLGQRDLGKV
jgi:flagella synthesis protein FlgN